MIYYKIDFQHQLVSPELDLLISDLGEIGFESFEQEQLIIKGYLPETACAGLDKSDFECKVSDILSTYSSVEIKNWEAMPDINWNKEWESHYEPVQIGSFCFVKAPFHLQTPSVKHVVLIEPKMSFGTAHHPTTALMIEFISQTEYAGKKVIDMGCGTGILAILANKEGASEVTAIDYDEWACNNAIENVERNKALQTIVIRGGKEVLSDYSADIIIANINRNVLIDQMECYSRSLTKGGFLFLSGFYTSDILAIEKEALLCGLILKEKKEKESWAALKFIA